MSEAVKLFPEYFVAALVGFTFLFWWYDRS